jgi:hypothetical protein
LIATSRAAVGRGDAALGRAEGPASRRLEVADLLRVTLSPAGIVLAGRWIPLALVGHGLPRYDPTSARTKLVESLSIEDSGNERFRIHSNGVIDPAPISQTPGR